MNATNGSVNFNDGGILSHRTSEDKYTGSFTLYDTVISNYNSSHQ